jgi:tricorn protease
VNGYALDVFSRRGYMNLTPRDLPTAPSRTVLGQRALERPTLLVTNQHSLSDAENFTEGYRSLKLGRVVGEPTAGWVVYTSNVSLIDGTLLRVPATRVTAADGSDMEMHPRPVDIEVHRDVGESDRGVDTQLDRAVRELLAELAPSRGLGRAGK